MPSPFHSTRWSLIQDAAASDLAQRDRAWAEFDHLYRKPLIGFIKGSGWDENRAEDLLQSFLAKLADRDWLSEADPERGRMRTFLVGRLKNHLRDARKHDLAEKRGGGVVAEPITSVDQGASTGFPEEGQFDREWAGAILNHTLEELRREAIYKGKEEIFEILQNKITGGSEEGISEAAGRLGMTEGAVRMQLQRLREKFREQLRSEVAETLLPGEDVSEEMRYLAKVLGEG